MQELKAELQTPQNADLAAAGERGAQQAQVLARYTTFVAEIEKYFDWRDGKLQDSLAMLKEESSSPSGDAAQGKWSEYFARCASDGTKMVTDAPKDSDVLAPELRRYAQSAATQEAAFFGQCGRMPLARMAAEAQRYTQLFHDEADKLEEKWEAFGESDRSIDEKVEDVVRQLDQLFEETVAKVVAEQRRVAELAAKVEFDPSKPVPDTALSAVVAIAKMGVQAIMQTLQRFQVAASAYGDALAQRQYDEGTIVFAFTQVREDVRQFMSRINFDVAMRGYNEAVATAQELAGACPTSGLQKDAKLFASTAAATVQPHMDRFKSGFEDFMHDLKDVFVGPVGDRTVEELVELSRSTASWDELQRLDLPNRLDAAFQDCERTWVMNVEGLSDNDKEALRDVWKKELDELGKGIVDAKQDRIHDHLKLYLKEKKAELAARLRDSRGGGQ
jgi:hypothetical protein